MRLRQRLVPYLSTLLQRYRDAYEPVMRPLFHDFPDDPDAWAETDDFLLGDAILVAPVTEPGVTTRRVRLPAGAHWRDAWTDEVFAGGDTVDQPAPYARPPFFIRLDPPSGIAPAAVTFTHATA
jgi:alpha-glucosidase